MDGYLSRDTIRLAALGVVVIAAIGMGAATITTTVDPGQAGGGTPPDWGDESTESQGSNGGGGGGSGIIDRDNDENESPIPQIQRCVRPLSEWYGALAYFGAFGLLLGAIKRRYSLGAAFMAMYAIAPVALVAYFLSTACATLGAGAGTQMGTPGTAENPSNPLITALDIPPIAVVGVFGIVLAVAAVALIRASGDQRVVEPGAGEDVDADQARVGDLAAAAGAAADRLEEHNADVDNEVYRAWGEMTAHLNVPNPDSSTPGEFAAAAIEAGVNRDDVEQLTRLFEEVRYGKRDPESREELAIEVFRRIESEYGADATADDDTEDNDGY